MKKLILLLIALAVKPIQSATFHKILKNIPSKVTVTHIVAHANNRIIGFNNTLPWGAFSEDLKRFKLLTGDNPVLMGRKTFESIPPKFRPLPQRRNIILTTDKSFSFPGCTVAHSLDEIELSPNELESHKALFIIGGESVYKQTLPDANFIYLTRIHATFEGDACYPEINLKEFIKCSQVSRKNEQFPYDFITLKRK